MDPHIDSPTTGSTSDLPETFQHTQKIDFSKPVQASNLKDKSIVVTGGARGLGGGSVTAFAEAGAWVTILDINEENGNALAKSLTDKGHHVQFCKTDTTSFESQMSAFKSAIHFSPRKTIDVVLASAGLGGTNIGNWLDKVTALHASVDPEPPTTTTLDVNLTAVYYTAHLALYYFKQTAKPYETVDKHLLFISSLAGYVALHQLGDYCASKYGVRGLWRTLRYSPRILGENMPLFRTNLICPTFIKTDMTTTIVEALGGYGIAMGEVEDVVAGIMRASCDDSIRGRAIAIAARDKVPGDKNFDICDDWEGLDGGREVLGKVRDSTIWGLEIVGNEAGQVRKDKYDGHVSELLTRDGKGGVAEVEQQESDTGV
ncbi:hypothetical protein BDV96DRAFT_646322 [Lophiotrema nucula]|uniref:NAD(P)-binding protein n=1 Tax=Lophiotrema nucula TaxID=690887 RepID=A0A6A5Z740_9PLEO|nr:hypothetical protein BDV96DRAFT_646322 [Lophiotrema nucula]